MKPIRICRTHDSQALRMSDGALFCVGNQLPVGFDDEFGEPLCDIIGVVWSGDGHALLEVVECDHVVSEVGEYGGKVTGYGLSNCLKCGGSGWQYAAKIRDINPWTDSPKVAVVPVKPLDKEQP